MHSNPEREATSHPDAAELLRCFGGEATPERAAVVAAHVEGCAACRAEWQRLDELAAGIADVEDAVLARDLVPGVRAAILALDAQATSRPARTAWRRGTRLGVAALALGSGLTAAAAALVLGLRAPDPAHDLGSDGFRVKGGAESADTWVGLQVSRLGGNGPAEPLGPNLRATDGLLVAYTNQGPEPFDYLMVLAIQDGEVFWLYPDGAPGGRSIAATRGAVAAELREVVRLPLRPGRLAIHALFSRRPLQVEDVEAAARGRAAGDRLPLPDTGQQVQVVEVLP